MKTVKATNRSIGVILMNIAVAVYLFATGIIGFKSGGEIRDAVSALFGTGDLSNVLVIILAVLAIAAGVFILLKLFGIIIPMFDIILIILALSWLFFIIMIDIVHPINKGNTDFVDWLRIFGSHLMVLSGMMLATERFNKK
jgi:hypothetical protein